MNFLNVRLIRSISFQLAFLSTATVSIFRMKNAESIAEADRAVKTIMGVGCSICEQKLTIALARRAGT